MRNLHWIFSLFCLPLCCLFTNANAQNEYKGGQGDGYASARVLRANGLTEAPEQVQEWQLKRQDTESYILIPPKRSKNLKYKLTTTDGREVLSGDIIEDVLSISADFVGIRLLAIYNEKQELCFSGKIWGGR